MILTLFHNFIFSKLNNIDWAFLLNTIFSSLVLCIGLTCILYTIRQKMEKAKVSE